MFGESLAKIISQGFAPWDQNVLVAILNPHSQHSKTTSRRSSPTASWVLHHLDTAVMPMATLAGMAARAEGEVVAPQVTMDPRAGVGLVVI